MAPSSRNRLICLSERLLAALATTFMNTPGLARKSATRRESTPNVAAAWRERERAARGGFVNNFVSDLPDGMSDCPTCQWRIALLGGVQNPAIYLTLVGFGVPFPIRSDRTLHPGERFSVGTTHVAAP